MLEFQSAAEAEAYREAKRLRADFAEAWNNLAICQGPLGDSETAIASLHTAIQLKPELADAHNNLGVAHYRLGRAGTTPGRFAPPSS